MKPQGITNLADLITDLGDRVGGERTWQSPFWSPAQRAESAR